MASGVAIRMDRFGAVPAEIRETSQWLTWCYVERGGKTKKVPVSPKSGAEIDHLDANDWRTFEQAAGLLASPYVDGVGFVSRTAIRSAS